jgi:hypothetical protein
MEKNDKFTLTQEERLNVKTIQVDYKCPKCIKGYLRPIMMTYGSPDIQYPHRCNNHDCDYKIVLPVRYPYIEYIPEDWQLTIIDAGNEVNITNPKYGSCEVTITDKTKICIKI